MVKSELQKHIERLVKLHGGVRAAARALAIDPAYLCRLRDGGKIHPTSKTLEKLGLRRIERIAPL